MRGIKGTNRFDNTSKEELEEIVERCKSLSDVLKFLGYKNPRGGNGKARAILRAFIKANEISIDHFRETSKVQPERHGRNMLRYSRNRRTDVAAYLKKTKLLEYKCEQCGLLPVWQDKPLTIHLHHIDGDGRNNQIENLQFLCPNCHSQTDNYGTRNHNNPNRARRTKPTE